MMNDMIRRPPEQYSPKSSPRGSRSPVVPRQDSTGTLKTTISLGKTPAIVHSGPFYLMKEIPSESEITGATNLMVHYNLEHAYNKCCGRKTKDQLSAFLPTLPGNIDTPGSQDQSSLRMLIDKPPIGGKELMTLTQSQLTGFRLHPGPSLPEQYRQLFAPVRTKKHKQKKSKHKGPGDTPSHEGNPAESLGEGAGANAASAHEKKHKKQRKHDDEKERKKKKKEKKKKKQKHSPDGAASSGLMSHASGPL